MRGSWSLYSAQISCEYGKEIIVLYRDEGLAPFENIGWPEAERIRKTFTTPFKSEFNLNIISETKLKVANFLNLTLNQI